MQLMRYYQWCIQKITANNYEYMVKFNDRKTPPGKIIFTSAQAMQNAVLASQCLSLTYSPRHRYDFDSKDFKLFDNEGNEIYSHNPNDFLRVWPAFGKYGGGIEVLVELNNNEITPSSDNILLDGGGFDRFHQDAILPLTDQILKLINDEVMAIFEIGEGGNGLVKGGLPVFKWKKNADNFTISVGIEETPDGMILHIWGTMWRDFDSLRCICCVLENEFQAFRIGRSELEERFKNANDLIFIDFSSKIKEIINDLLKCKESDHLFMKCIPYPAYIVRFP